MSYVTLSTLVQSTIKTIGLVSGTSVQTYSEPIIEEAIQQMFDLLFRKRFWPHMTDFYTYTLDGVTGVVTTDLTSILKHYNDVDYIEIPDTMRRIVKPTRSEHLEVNGSTPLYYTPIIWTNGSNLDVTRVLKFWPVTATGKVRMRIRTKPDDFGTDDTIPLDRDLMAYATAWHVLDSDGINPGAASKAQGLFEIAYKDIVGGDSNDAIGHGGGRYAHNTVWLNEN